MHDEKGAALGEGLLQVGEAPRALTDELLIDWEVKTYAHPTLFLDVSMGVAWILFAVLYMCGRFFLEDESVSDAFIDFGMVGMVMFFYLWITCARQKTLYTYVITERGGEVKYWLYYPKCVNFIFKGLVVFVFVAFFAMISVIPSMIFAILGMAGVTLVAAVKLWGWENEVEYSRFKWHRTQLIFTDRKRNLVVLQRRYDPDIPFEKNYMYFEVFLPKGKVDEFLDIFKKYAPPHVDYEEGRLKY